MPVWDEFLTGSDREVFAAAGYGERMSPGDRPALLVIDVTYGFCGDRREPILESIKRWRGSCGERAWDALPQVARLITLSRGIGIPVIYTKGRGRGDGGRWADKNARQSSDTERRDQIVAEVAPNSSDLVIEKSKPSAFFGTTLASHLVSLRADSLVVCGATTSGCVRATVVDAFSYDYRVAVAEEATFDRGEASHALALFDVDMKYANVMSVDGVVDFLEGVSAAGGGRRA